MKDIAELLKEPGVSIAVVGANDHPEKYGSVIYRDLKRKGFKLFPVNFTRPTVDGDQAYKNISDIPEKPTIINFVTPPAATLKVLKECLAKGFMNVWIQPGAEDPDVLRFVQENHFNYLANACIMVESRLKN